MKRRGFLQALAGFVGFAITPTISAKEKQLPIPINLGSITPKPYIEFNREYINIWEKPLTIDHFGASNTKSLTKTPKPAFFTGMRWYPPGEYFPDTAEEGDAFYFTPKTYHGYEIDEKTKDALECCYIYTANGWCPFIGVSKTQDS